MTGEPSPAKPIVEPGAPVRTSFLRFSGIVPVRETLVGTVEAANDVKRRCWLELLARVRAARQSSSPSVPR